MAAAADGQGIAVIDVMNVIGQEQRTGMFRYVWQRFPGVIRIFQHFGVGVAVAGDHAEVIGDGPGQIHFHALGTHFARRFGHRLIANALGVQHVTLMNIKQRDIGGNAV